MSNPKLRCPCGWEGMTDELQSVCVFHQTQEEPAEYEDTCPCCDRPFDELEEVPLCASCGDVYVHQEDDKCGECVEAEMEDAYEARREIRREVDMIICDHRNAAGLPMETWRLYNGAEVCARCHHGASVKQPISVRNWLVQADFAETEMRAMTGMMREVGMEFFNYEVMGTAAQYEEFKRRWVEKYPERSFNARYGSKPD